MGNSVVGLGTNQKRELFTPEGLPLAFSLAEDINPDFIIFASCIIGSSGVYAPPNPITWQILDRSTAHGSVFFTGFDSTASVNLQLFYPEVRTVLNGSVTLDEKGANAGLFAGPTVALNNMVIQATINRVNGTRLIADGAGNWSNAFPAFANTYFSVSAFGAPGVGETGVRLLNFTNPDPNLIGVVYNGAANFTINRRYAGLGIFDIVFSMIDAATGLPLAVNPAAGESVILTTAGIVPDIVPHNNFAANNNFMSGTGFNYWVHAWFEAWMVARQSSGTSNVVRWQTNFPGATDYKLYRDTSPTFGTKVLIHTGTEGVFVDTGIIANTQYYYQLIAVVGGIDTQVTTWAIRTKA